MISAEGFYLTSFHEQAVRYAQRFLRRQKEAWLNSYELEFEPSEWKILEFDSYDRNWLNFIANCRAGKDTTDFDIVIGLSKDRTEVTVDARINVT